MSVTLSVVFFMYIFNFYVLFIFMFMKHTHAICACNIFMQDMFFMQHFYIAWTIGHAERINSIFMLHSTLHEHSTWTYSLDMDIQDRHAAWSCEMEIQLANVESANTKSANAKSANAKNQRMPNQRMSNQRMPKVGK